MIYKKSNKLTTIENNVYFFMYNVNFYKVEMNLLMLNFKKLTSQNFIFYRCSFFYSVDLNSSFFKDNLTIPKPSLSDKSEFNKQSLPQNYNKKNLVSFLKFNKQRVFFTLTKKHHLDKYFRSFKNFNCPKSFHLRFISFLPISEYNCIRKKLWF